MTTCNMGMGCDEAGKCYAAAIGQPELCERRAMTDKTEINAGNAWINPSERKHYARMTNKQFEEQYLGTFAPPSDAEAAQLFLKKYGQPSQEVEDAMKRTLPLSESPRSWKTFFLARLMLGGVIPGIRSWKIHQNLDATRIGFSFEFQELVPVKTQAQLDMEAPSGFIEWPEGEPCKDPITVSELEQHLQGAAKKLFDDAPAKIPYDDSKGFSGIDFAGYREEVTMLYPKLPNIEIKWDKVSSNQVYEDMKQVYDRAREHEACLRDSLKQLTARQRANMEPMPGESWAQFDKRVGQDNPARVRLFDAGRRQGKSFLDSKGFSKVVQDMKDERERNRTARNAGVGKLGLVPDLPPDHFSFGCMGGIVNLPIAELRAKTKPAGVSDDVWDKEFMERLTSGTLNISTGYLYATKPEEVSISISADQTKSFYTSRMLGESDESFQYRVKHKISIGQAMLNAEPIGTRDEARVEKQLRREKKERKMVQKQHKKEQRNTANLLMTACDSVEAAMKPTGWRW